MTTIIQRSFSGGEIDPALGSRIDLAKYMTGFAVQRNFMTEKTGVLTNRPGTQFICKCGDQTGNALRLIEFEFNSAQTYILEFGEDYMRVIKNGVQLTDKTVTPITSITQANPGVFTYASHGFFNGDEVQASGFIGMTYFNNQNFRVSNVTTNTFRLETLGFAPINTTSFPAYTGGGTLKRVYQTSTPYSAADLPTLNYVQSADVITFVHPNYPPLELSRTGDTSWSFNDIDFAPTTPQITGLSLSGFSGSLSQSWAVTALDATTFEESLPVSATLASSALPTQANPVKVTWTNVSSAGSYNVYQLLNGVYSFIGVAGSGTTGFTVDGTILPDNSVTPPTLNTPFDASNLYPSNVFYYQERRGFVNSNSFPERVWMTRSGQYYNLTLSTPIQDDDAITFDVRGRQINRIQSAIDLGIALVLLTQGGEHACLGDGSGTITPSAINRKQYSYNGSGTLRPILINTSGVYANLYSNEIRDIEYRFVINGYGGDDLTTFAKHLFRNNYITDWAYGKVPNSIIWAIRDDGQLLGFTYVKEQQIIAWHHHDTGSDFFLNVACVSEGSRTAPYVIVQRANGRMIERIQDNIFTDIRDAWYLDSALKYDGRNDPTLGFSSPIQINSTYFRWDSTDVYTLTITQAGGYTFTTADVGNEFQINGVDNDGNPITLRFLITAYIDSFDVTATLVANIVPTGMQAGRGTVEWVRAVNTVSGLWNLEGLEVAIIADGYVVGNPNNSSINQIFTVTNGTLSLGRNYGVILVGIPITADIQTLNIDMAQGTIADKPMNINKVNIDVYNSRGIWAGESAPTGDDPLEDMTQIKCRTDDDSYGVPALKSEVLDVIIAGNWRKGGSIFLRQVDPLPLTIRSIMPAGYVPMPTDLEGRMLR